MPRKELNKISRSSREQNFFLVQERKRQNFLSQVGNSLYCKWHNSFSRTTNDCNVFCQRIQSSVNEGRLSFLEMQIDKHMFPLNMWGSLWQEGGDLAGTGR